MIIEEKLKLIAQRSGKTYDDFAQSIGVKKAAFSNYINGKRKVPLDVMQTIIEKYNINPAFFFDTSNSENIFLPDIPTHTIGLNIRRLRKKNGLTQEELAEKLGIKHTSISAWESGRNKPLMDKVEMMAKIFNTDKGAIVGDYIKQLDDIYPIQSNPMSHTIPIYGSIAAGCPNWAEDNVIGDLSIPNQLLSRHGIENLVALEIEGDSMNKIVPNGFYAVIDLNMGEVYNGDIVAVRLDCYATTLKRFYKTNNSIILEPDSYNPEHKPFIFDCTNIYECPEIEVIGRYVWSCAPID